MTLNELVKLTTLWTTGPWCIEIWDNESRLYFLVGKSSLSRAMKTFISRAVMVVVWRLSSEILWLFQQYFSYVKLLMCVFVRASTAILSYIVQAHLVPHISKWCLGVSLNSRIRKIYHHFWIWKSPLSWAIKISQACSNSGDVVEVFWDFMVLSIVYFSYVELVICVDFYNLHFLNHLSILGFDCLCWGFTVSVWGHVKGGQFT